MQITPQIPRKRKVKKVTVADLDAIDIQYNMGEGRTAYRRLTRRAARDDEPTIGGKPAPGTSKDTLDRIDRGIVKPEDVKVPPS